MVKPHPAKYSQMQATELNCFFASFWTIRYMFTNWPVNNKNKLKKGLLLIFSPFYIIFSCILAVLTLLGNIINILLIVRVVYNLIFIIIWNLNQRVFALLINSYDKNNYLTLLVEFDQSFNI